MEALAGPLDWLLGLFGTRRYCDGCGAGLREEDPSTFGLGPWCAPCWERETGREYVVCGGPGRRFVRPPLPRGDDLPRESGVQRPLRYGPPPGV